MKRSAREIIRRYILLVIGLFVAALGVSISVKADLGTSPIACCPVVFNRITGISVGNCMCIMCAFFIVLQFIVLRKEFQIIQLLQLPVAYVFGYFTDFTLFLLTILNPSDYIARWFWCAIGIIVLAFGVFLETKADVIMLSPDAFIATFSRKTHKEFGKNKVFVDCSLVTIAVIVSLCLFHELTGVREGTVAAAIFVGMIVRLFNRKISFVDRVLVDRKRTAKNETVDSLSVKI